MKYFNLYITLLALLISCKEVKHNPDSIQNSSSQLDSIITNDNDGVVFIKEFYTKYYSEFRDRKGIEKG